jgi:hypothetical protein
MDDLIMAGGTASGRDKVESMTGISGKEILKWVNHVDLMRIPGVGSQYSDLLEPAGVDSPAELAQRNAANFAETFQELEAARPNTVRRVPSLRSRSGSPSPRAWRRPSRTEPLSGGEAVSGRFSGGWPPSRPGSCGAACTPRRRSRRRVAAAEDLERVLGG